MSKWTEWIGQKKWRKLRKDQWLILFLAGILLLVIALPSSCGGEEKEEEAASAAGQTSAASVSGSREEYEKQLEQRLAEVLSSMEGVGKVRVMITFQDSGEAVVEKDTTYSRQEQRTEGEEGEVTESSQTESSETAVYSSGSEEGGPLIRKQNLPAIEGVLVVAQGGGEQAVAADISEAVEALFGLEVHKIKVVEMNQVQEGSE